jgi:hypothetical protein
LRLRTREFMNGNTFSSKKYKMEYMKGVKHDTSNVVWNR